MAGNKPYMSPKARVRFWWLFVHRWLGLALLVPMAMLGVTGSALVWPDKTELLLNPQRAVAAHADPARIEARHIATARAGLATYGPVTAALIGEPGFPLMLGTAPVAPPHMGLGPPTRMTTYVDPLSGQLIDTKRSTGDFIWYMHAIHGHLLLRGVGRPVVGVMGIFLLLSAITGIVIWWPGRGRILSALRWRRREGKLLNIHRQSGVLLSLVLIVEAISGLWISFPGFFAMIVDPGAAHVAGGHGGEARGPRSPGNPRPPSPPPTIADQKWVDVLAQAQAAYPGRPTSIAVPKSAGGAWEVGVNGARGPATLRIPDTGPVAIEVAADGATRASRWEAAMTDVHAATIGGPIWQWLSFLSGIALTFLSLSGLYIWGKRRILRGRRGVAP
ncbi:MAG: PepSY domain-containing protein [Sphingomonadaceae bacterium]|nr:PepSY domain-containing protein [Sphingomonadaceae bacterium]